MEQPCRLATIAPQALPSRQAFQRSQPAAPDAHVGGGATHIGGKAFNMNKVDPHIVAVKVHAGSAHMKRVVSALSLARVLVPHSVIFCYSNRLNSRNRIRNP